MFQIQYDVRITSYCMTFFFNRRCNLLAYNPTTEQLIRLPQAPSHNWFCNAGIRFDPLSSPPQFKVAWLVKKQTSTLILQLFSSRTNTWRQFETSIVRDYDMDRYHSSQKFIFTDASVFIDLAYFFTFMLEFDFQKESFQRIELPATRHARILGKCNGHICYSEKYEHLFKIWKLESEEGRYRWTPIYQKSCIILEKQLQVEIQLNSVLKFTPFLPNSEGMLIVMGEKIYTYDFNASRLVQVDVIEKNRGVFGVFPFSLCPTYIPLGPGS